MSWNGKRGRIARVSGSRAFVRLIADNRMPTGEEEEVSLGTLSPIAPTERRDRSQAGLELRTTSAGTLRVRASNDTVVDHYGKVITVESLHDWWIGFSQHRTVSLQHDLDLRGIPGKPQVAVGLSIDFTPQLEVRLRVLDDETKRLIRERKIRSASLEFVPIGEEVRVVNGEEVGFYYRLSSEPEHCGLGLVDIPGVPDSDILEIRHMSPSWAFAVVDPKVLSGEVTDPLQIEQLRYLPHHNLKTRMVDEAALARALRDLDSLSVPPFASLPPEEVKRRAFAHLSRHTVNGIAMRSVSAPYGPAKPDPADLEETQVKREQWLKARTAMYVAEGLDEAAARKRAEADLSNSPQLRTKLEGADAFEGFARNSLDLNINLRSDGVPQQEQQAQQQQVADKPKDEPKTQESKDEGKSEEGKKGEDKPEDKDDPQLEQRVNTQVDRRVQALLAQPENPMAAIASGLQMRSAKLDPDELLSEVLFRTVTKQMQGQQVTAQDRQETENILKRNGIKTRALTIEGNGTVIYEELARQFVVKPQPDIIGRNHFNSVPMQGTKKTDFPRFDRAGIGFQWNRSSSAGGGSLAQITPSDPTLDTFPLEVTELNGMVPIADSFLQFNTAGAAFVQSYLLPQLRGATQYEEDAKFFLSTGTHPDPATFRGILRVQGGTVVAATAEPFNLGMLGGLLRAMPVNYRNQTARLAFYLSVSTADDYADELEDRKTPIGDRTLERFENVPGPMPVGVYRGVPIFSVPHVEPDENNQTKIALVHRDIPVIGDALSIRIEPFRDRRFVTELQVQEYVGLGYQFPEAIVRRDGVQPRA